MKKDTGRTVHTGFMTIPPNRVVKINDLIFNCHKCKKIFSPVKATLLSTTFYGYVSDIFSRMFLILEIDENVCNCRDIDTISMYDNIDPIQKEFVKEKLDERNK